MNYLYQDTLALPNIVFTTAVISVLLTDFLSGRFAASVIAPVARTIRSRVETVLPGASSPTPPSAEPAAPQRDGESPVAAPPAAHSNAGSPARTETT